MKLRINWPLFIRPSFWRLVINFRFSIFDFRFPIGNRQSAIVNFVVLVMIFLIFLLGQLGCERAQLETVPSSKADHGFDTSLYTPFAPVKIDIMPLTEFVISRDAGEIPEINIYVSLLDSFGSQCKSPGTFRFEMYEYIQLSSQPLGKRIAIWPDIDLTEAAENNKYWRDFLRAYQFNLPLEPAGSQDYILHVTFLCPAGKRLLDEFIVKQTK